MTESIALAIAVPAALGAAWLASRRSWSPAAADNRGIALQTVIVIVVMLVIAGGVAAVLLSRGADVTGQLQAQDITAGVNTERECDLLQPRADVATAEWDATDSECVLTGNADANEITEEECTSLGGDFGDSGTQETCTIG